MNFTVMVPGGCRSTNLKGTLLLMSLIQIKGTMSADAHALQGPLETNLHTNFSFQLENTGPFFSSSAGGGAIINKSTVILAIRSLLEVQ